MNRSIIRNLVVAALLAYPASALGADQAPDVKGKWVGKTHTIIAGRGMHWPKSRGTFEKPALFEKDLVIEITGQEGRRFWGTTTISGGGEKTDEPFIGELTGKDNRSFVFADTDGFWNGQLDGNDALSFCYMHTGGKPTSTKFLAGELLIEFTAALLRQAINRALNVALQGRKLAEQIIEIRPLSMEVPTGHVEQTQGKRKNPTAKYKPAAPAW